MTTLAFDTHKFVKELTAAGIKTAQAEVLASSYASLLTNRITTKDDLKALETRIDGRLAALEDRLNDRHRLCPGGAVAALSAVIVLVAFLAAGRRNLLMIRQAPKRWALHRQDGTASSLARGKRLMRSGSLF